MTLDPDTGRFHAPKGFDITVQEGTRSRTSCFKTGTDRQLVGQIYGGRANALGGIYWGQANGASGAPFAADEEGDAVGGAFIGSR